MIYSKYDYSFDTEAQHIRHERLQRDINADLKEKAPYACYLASFNTKKDEKAKLELSDIPF